AARANGTPGWSTAVLRFSRQNVTPARSANSPRRVRVRAAEIHSGPGISSPGTTGRPLPSRPVPCRFSRGQPSVSAAAMDSCAVIERDLGLAFGLVVRSMGFAKSFGAGLTSLRQGEVPQYTRLLEDSRRHAIDRMVENARLLGANAIVAMRFDSSEISQQLT